MKTKETGDNFEATTAERMKSALERALNTPPKPHKPAKGKAKRSSKRESTGKR